MSPAAEMIEPVREMDVPTVGVVHGNEKADRIAAQVIAPSAAGNLRSRSELHVAVPTEEVYYPTDKTSASDKN